MYYEESIDLSSIDTNLLKKKNEELKKENEELKFQIQFLEEKINLYKMRHL